MTTIFIFGSSGKADPDEEVVAGNRLPKRYGHYNTFEEALPHSTLGSGGVAYAGRSAAIEDDG